MKVFAKEMSMGGGIAAKYEMVLWRIIQNTKIIVQSYLDLRWDQQFEYAESVIHGPLRAISEIILLKKVYTQSLCGVCHRKAYDSG